MEKPIIVDMNGFIYYQEDLFSEGVHYMIKTIGEYQSAGDHHKQVPF